MSDPEYLDLLAKRLKVGKAPHMEVLLMHYAYGKPQERIEVTAVDITALDVFLVEARNGANGSNGHSGPGSTGGPVIEIEHKPTNGDGAED